MIREVEAVRAWDLIPDMRGLVTARQLAERHKLSERTIYRYIKYLKSRGVDIRSGSGAGYLVARSQMYCPCCGEQIDVPAPLDRA